LLLKDICYTWTVLIRHLVGFSDVLWSLDGSEEKPVNFPKVKPNQLMILAQGVRV
jgi:hypothetical protein